MTTDLAGIARAATFTECGRYRLTLSRRWGEGSMVAWLMLNPSTADDETDDPTVRRVMDWADRWGHHAVTIVNVFAFRASRPRELWRWLAERADDPIDHYAEQANRLHIQEAAQAAALRMVGFGADVGMLARPQLDAALEAFGGDGVMCLATSKDGWPTHPKARGKQRIPDYATPKFWAPLRSRSTT